MELREAEQQKIFVAEKQLSYVRAVVIVFGTLTFFLLNKQYLHEKFAYVLMLFIWSYGAFVLFFKPYEKYPVFLASWFTYTGDCILTTLWIYATGSFYSPYYVIYYTSIIAVAFRFGLKTTLFTSGLYSLCYIALLGYFYELSGNETVILVRIGFIFITGFLTNFITEENLHQTQQNLIMKKLVDESQQNQKMLARSQESLAALNEALKQKNLELERTNSELASFNYVASHDLQEPVRKIYTFCQLILQKEKGFSDAGKDYLSRISAGARRMQHLIEAFLNYARMDSSSIIFEKTNLNSIIDEVRSNLYDVIKERQAVITIHELPTIKSVPFQMQQLFINLVSNAIKYAKANVAPEITIAAEKVTGVNKPGLNQGDFYWKIKVADNGIGFDQQYAEKIFEVFQRLHGKDEYAGTGIGLAICKKIALLHKGAIEAEGKPGIGAVFSIYFPADL